MTEGWGGLSGNDDDQPDEPAPVRTAQQERADVVAWLNKKVRDEDQKAADNRPLRGWHTIRASAWHEAANWFLSGQHEGASDDAD